MMKAIDFGSLLGAQVTALVEAELEAAESTSQFIEAVGFEKDKDGSLALRMVAFDMVRRDSDGKMRKHTISIPALTLVPLPLLTVESATIDFSARVESVHDRKDDEDRKLPRRQFPLAKRKRLVTRLARRQQGGAYLEADLNVSVKLAQSPFPLGIERLLNTADLSVQDETDE